MDECGLALAQIHGDESAEYCESLGRPVIRGIRLRDRNTLFAMAEYKGRSRVRGFVLDAFSETAYGGTGKTADWTLATEAAQSFSFLLAGGLNRGQRSGGDPNSATLRRGREQRRRGRSGQERPGQGDGLHPSRETCLIVNRADIVRSKIRRSGNISTSPIPSLQRRGIRKDWSSFPPLCKGRSGGVELNVHQARVTNTTGKLFL